jgi:hypothetical protein
MLRDKEERPPRGHVLIYLCSVQKLKLGEKESTTGDRSWEMKKSWRKRIKICRRVQWLALENYSMYREKKIRVENSESLVSAGNKVERGGRIGEK